jgi:hypothetical protein
VPVARTLSDEELKQSIAESRAEAWRDHRGCTANSSIRT